MMVRLNLKFFLLGSSIAVLGFAYFVAGSWFTLEQLQHQYRDLYFMVHERYVFSVVAYHLLYVGLVAVSFPAAGLMTLAGGALFGTWQGTLYACVAGTCGGLISFLGARYISRSFLEQKWPDTIRTLHEKVAGRGASALISLRLIPFFPFFIVNPLLGLTHISVPTFLWTTVLGIIPSTFIFSCAGQRCAQLSSLRDVLSMEIMLLFTLVGIVLFWGRRR